MNLLGLPGLTSSGHLADGLKAVPFKAAAQSHCSKPLVKSEFSFSHGQRQPNSSFFLGRD
jgi:hypothetical protein